MTVSAAQGITWNLNDLYSSPEDPRIEQDLKLAREKAIAFENKYKPLFAKPASLPIFDLVHDYKEIVTLLTKPSVYSSLMFSGQTNAAAIGAFMQHIQVTITDIQSHLLFFEVEWNKLDENTVKKLTSDSKLAADLHYLQKMRAWAPHTLKEGEEKIMAIKDDTGSNAFSRLFDETMNSVPFFIEEKGQRAKKTEGEVLSLLHSTDRNVRRQASDSLAEGLEGSTRLLTYIYNMILADHRSDMKIRHYAHPMDSMNLSNEIDLKSVLNLVHSVKKGYPIAQRYYRLKTRLLGLDKMTDYDRYAPVGTDNEKIDWKKCREIVLSGYYAFSDEVGKIIEQFFDKRWIDAEVREGKQGGGFCCSTTPDLHPYILVNYTGNIRDVMTVAHELGHGLHQWLARKAGILEQHAPLTMAETASVFGEMLIFEKILSDEKDPAKQLDLLCGKIDDNFATVFRQIVLTDFELRAHDGGLKNGELSSERLSDEWIAANTEFYGDSVELTQNYRHGWKYIPHFIHSPFYCYAYSFAQLFVLSLFQRYRQNKASFIPVYLEMLTLGGSKKPQEIAKLAGLDLSQENFWQNGLSLLDGLVSQAESIQNPHGRK